MLLGQPHPQLNPDRMDIAPEQLAVTEADVRALVAEIRRRVLSDTGVQLERELKYWDEV